MSKKYCVYKKVKDNIPGFRDPADVDLVSCFDNRSDAESLRNELDAKEGGSVEHEGYGAGPGTIDTYFYIKEENH